MVKKGGLPKWGEHVLCTATRITPFAAWCTLDEYEAEDGSRIECMIHISEVAGKWVKDIRDFVKPNKRYIAKVIRIDYQKGHLNLSLRRVSKFDKKEAMEKYRRTKRAAGMLMRAMKRIGKTESDAHGEVVAKLEKIFYEKRHEAEGKFAEKFDLFYAFEEANEDPSTLTEAGITKEWADALVEVIKKNFRVKERTLKAALNLTSIAPDGVKIIKKVLSNLEETTSMNVKYISAPKYRVDIKSKNPKEAEKKLKEGLEGAIKEIKALGGDGSYKLIK